MRFHSEATLITRLLKAWPLSKLMLGEIQLKDAEKAVEAAL